MTDKLARRYRRLLLAYPRAYRRSRGDELLGALLDAAAPGRTGPTVREAANLIRHGLRAHLGRPASRTVVVWAVLTVVISGVFSAAFATRAGWETARPLPRTAQARAMLAEILPGQDFTGIHDAPALFVIYGQPLSWNSARDLLFGDGGEYDQSGIAGVASAPTLPPQETVELVQHNLRAHGWTVYSLKVRDIYTCTEPCDPGGQYTTIVAQRGDTVFRMDVYSPQVPISTPISAGFVRATPFAVYPFGLTGGILGAVVAFLLFGWASRRTEGRHPARGVVKLLLSVTLFFWWAPTLYAVPWMARHYQDEPNPSWPPMWEWLGQPTFSLLFLIACGSALLGLALAALPRGDREPLSTAAV
ncbi:hypothetical protein AB0M46_05070 [Dactylosporangium sp. NPDC051485]|uniref:hypothetical protein n=1 Tax=Dactylosporangium sp. NPDC051485 TaxID=3154846 RepID=UPI00343ACFCC